MVIDTYTGKRWCPHLWIKLQMESNYAVKDREVSIEQNYTTDSQNTFRVPISITTSLTTCNLITV